MKKKMLTAISLALLLGMFIGKISLNASGVNEFIDVGDIFSWDIKTDQIGVSLYPGFSVYANERIKATVLFKGSIEMQLQSELKKSDLTHVFGILNLFQEAFDAKLFHIYGMLILPLNRSDYYPMDSYLASEGFSVAFINNRLHLSYTYYTFEYDTNGVLRSLEFDSPAGSYSVKLVTHKAVIIPMSILGGLGLLIGGFFLAKLLLARTEVYRSKREKRLEAEAFLAKTQSDRKSKTESKEISPTIIPDSIPLSVPLLSNQSVMNIFFSAFAIATFYFFINIETFLITKPIFDVKFGPYWFASHEEQVDRQLLTWGAERIDQIIGGFIVASLLILTGYLWIVKVNANKEERKGLKTTISSMLIASGALLIVSSVLQGIAYKTRLVEDITEEVQKMMNISYWIEASCFVLLFIILIMISVEFGKTEYKCLVHNAVWMIIGFAILSVGSVFAILAMEFYFSEYMLYSYTLITLEYLPKLLLGYILPTLGKIIITSSFVFALIKFQKRKMSVLFVGGFQTVGAIYVLTLFTKEVLRFLYMFLYPSTVLTSAEEYVIYTKKLMNLDILSVINQALFWILLLGGTFALAKAIVFDGNQVEYSEYSFVPDAPVLDPDIPVIPMVALGEISEETDEKEEKLAERDKEKEEKLAEIIKEKKEKQAEKDKEREEKLAEKDKEREEKLAEREKKKEEKQAKKDKEKKESLAKREEQKKERQTKREKKKEEKKTKGNFCTICGERILRGKLQCRKCREIVKLEKEKKKPASKKKEKQE